MKTDHLAQYLDSLQRESQYRVEAVLKEAPHEVTQKVTFIDEEGTSSGPYVRKFIKRESGLGSAYERLFTAQCEGRQFEHLPRILECYTHDDELVVVMEFVHGETLQEHVYRLDPSEELALDVFPRLCDAASELHESFDSPIIHRDLKPSNVILSDDALTIIDFGIAREFREDAESDTVKFGTRAFAPPEQFGYGQTTVRSDIYALGMLLYFCLSEKIPTAQVREGHFEEDGIPSRMRPVLMRATAFDPDGRYASAAELKAAFLEATERDKKTPDGIPSATQPNRERQPRGRRTAAVIAIAIVAVAAILLALIAGGVFGQPGNRADSAASLSQESQSSSWKSTTAGNADDVSSSANEVAEEAAANNMQTGAPPRNGFNPATNVAATIAGVTFQIPGSFTSRVTQGQKGVTYYYAETGSSLAMIMTAESSISSTDGQDQAPDVETIKNEYLSGLLGSDDIFTEITASTDCELAGYPARIVSFRGTAKGLSISSKAVYFINEDDAEENGTTIIGSIVFGQTDNAQFDYSADFAQTIASATPAGSASSPASN